MKKHTIRVWLTFGFALGFFVAIIVLSILQSEVSYSQSLFRQCNRTEFAIQIYDRSLATIVMSC